MQLHLEAVDHAHHLPQQLDQRMVSSMLGANAHPSFNRPHTMSSRVTSFGVHISLLSRTVPPSSPEERPHNAQYIPPAFLACNMT